MVFTDSNFKTEVQDFKGIVLVDFWAEWCGPCRILGPIVEEVAADLQSKPNVKIGKLNVDENPTTAQSFNVMSIPTILIFKDGQAVSTLIGVKPKATIIASIEEALA